MDRFALIRHRRRAWRSALAVCGLFAGGAAIAAASPQSPPAPGPARTQAHGSAYEIGNRWIAARVSAAAGHLQGLRIENRQNPRTLSIPEILALEMSDGSEVTASRMNLDRTPEVEDLQAIPASPRAADRLPGREVCAELSLAAPAVRVRWCAILRDGSNYLRQQVTIRALDRPLGITRIRLLRLDDPPVHGVGAHLAGSVAGSPVIDSDMFFGFEHPLSSSQVQGNTIAAYLNRTLPLRAQRSITCSSVVGVAAPGQMRRSFLNYIERERAHPYRTFLHYNTWYDLGYGGRYDQAGALDRVRAFGEQLTRQRGVVLDSFLFDDGWDNPQSLWDFDSGFPDGFTPVGQAAARRRFGIGVWLSPWGGYAQAKKERIAYGRRMGYEIVNGGYALSGPRYYAAFERACLRMIDQFKVNQFKFDGTGNANQVFPGSIFDSDFDAAIHLIERLRRQEPAIYINLTTGTHPSPFWLLYADSIWRGGADHSFAGAGSWRQRWITYRDAQTYKNVVLAGPLFPLSSLMLHGIIYAQFAAHLGDDPGHDFADEVRDFFGSGTQLQEMYITPSLLKTADWNVLAECAKWSRANAPLLRDTHWIGGDPGVGQVYGWASWADSRGIIVLRNPADRPQDFALELSAAFELPPGAAKRYRAHSPWTADAASKTLFLHAGSPWTIHLAPFQVLTLEMSAQR